MAFVRKLQCDKCSRTEFHRWVDIYQYVLENDTTFPSPETPAWCLNCDGIRGFETLPAEESLRKELERLETSGIDREDYRQKCDFLRQEFRPESELNKQLARQHVVVQWRQSRNTPPRCLTCGATEHLEIASDTNDLEHPGCGGRFQLIERWHTLRGYILCDGEGNVLNR